MIVPCEQQDDGRLFNIEITSSDANTEKTMEDVGRRKIIKTITNIFAFTAFFDVGVSFPLIILLLKANVFTEIASLLACMQITCFLFLSFISAWLIFRSRNNFDERIDAIGAWVVVHFVSLIGNVSLVVFEAYPKPTDMIDKSFLLIILVCWKMIFVLLEVGSSLYSFYIVHKPVLFITAATRPRHPLFEQTGRPVDEVEGSAPNITLVNEIPPAVVHNMTSAGRYGSYLSLSQDTDSRFVRNPCYESELSLEYANNYSPYDDMVLANRNRLSYAERVPRGNRPYLHNETMSNRNSYISSHESTQNNHLPNAAHPRRVTDF